MEFEMRKHHTARTALKTSVVLLAASLLCGVSLDRCSPNTSGFEQVSLNGFDPQNYLKTQNDYPWSMTYFVPDGGTGRLYVGTGNGIMKQALYRLGILPADETPYYPCEIRRYRPDLGPKEWEQVFSYREVESGPDFSSTGFRCMAVYRAKCDGVNYLYASTFGDSPAVWRSPTGEPGSWSRIWGSAETGSIRWLAPHNGILYIAISNDVANLPKPASIWATDGDSIWQVMDGGFGNANNRAVMSMISYNGWLYAGTANAIDGYEIWKLEGPDGGAPIKVVDAGGPDARNQSAATPYVFQGNLYYGSQIFLGIKFKGCDLIRIDANDHWDTIVGKDGLSGYASGFNCFAHAYLWWMVEHDGWLYASIWDSTSLVQYGADHLPLSAQAVPALVAMARGLRESGQMVKRSPGWVSAVDDAGAGLYRSRDGVQWETVFTNGLGDPYNYGVRTMVSLDGYLYLGMANTWDGLEIWRGEGPAQQ
jgi:hypothetical protein